MFKKILIANDGSEGAFKALVVALRHADQVISGCIPTGGLPRPIDRSPSP